MSDSKIWDRLHDKVKDLDRKNVKVGLIGSKGGDAPSVGGDFTLVDIGAVHEFGTDDGIIPERRWLRGAFENEGEKALYDMLLKLAKGILADRFTPDAALELLGTWAADRVKFRITNGEIVPENAAATIIRKNRRAGQPDDAKVTTLVDTGQMKNAITHEVER